MSDGGPIYYDCFLCERPFQFGPHLYRGRLVRAWDIMVCDSCVRGNWDGVVPSMRPHLVPYLESKGVEGLFNEKGWINIPE